jgi:hypothetical protein
MLKYATTQYLHVQKMTRNKNLNHEPATLERLFGSSAATRIIDQLTLFQDDAYSQMEIAKNSDVSFPHALKEIQKLEELNLITKTKTIGRAKLYKLNTNNPAAQLLIKFKFELAMQEAQKIAEQEIAKEEQNKQTQTIPAT